MPAKVVSFSFFHVFFGDRHLLIKSSSVDNFLHEEVMAPGRFNLVWKLLRKCLARAVFISGSRYWFCSFLRLELSLCEKKLQAYYVELCGIPELWRSSTQAFVPQLPY